MPSRWRGKKGGLVSAISNVGQAGVAAVDYQPSELDEERRAAS